MKGNLPYEGLSISPYAYRQINYVLILYIKETLKDSDSDQTLGSAATGAVQSPPGFDDPVGATVAAPPPPGFYPMTTASSGIGMVASSSGVTHGRSTPVFPGPSTTPKHFRFPPGGGAIGQVSSQQVCPQSNAIIVELLKITHLSTPNSG